MRLTNDKLLIEGCKKNKMWAQKRVYEKYAPRMLSLCMRYLSDKSEAEDVLQEGFIKVFNHITQYNSTGEFGSWLRRIFINTALLHIRKKKRNPIFQSDDEEFDISNDKFEYTNIDAVSVDDLMCLIGKLPEKNRIIFNLYAIEGYSYEELEKMLEVPQSSLRSTVSRSRKFLQTEVMKLMNKK